MAKNANQRQKDKIRAAAKAAAPKPATSTLSNTYADGSTVIYRDGRFVVIGPDGKEIVGATPTVTGAGRGYRAPVNDLTDLPAGSYDPSLIYQSQNANLGQLYNTQDFQTQYGSYKLDADGKVVPTYRVDPNTGEITFDDDAKNGRAFQDYTTARGALSQALARAQADYGTATETLGRNYKILGNNQLQGINQRGLLSGGALAQALAKRTENQGRDQSGLDLSWNRYKEDNATGVKTLGTEFSRGFADASTTVGRGEQSNALYQGGLFNTASAQANQSGMLVDNPNYQTHNGVLYQVMPDGKRVPVKNTKKKQKPPKPPRDTSTHPTYPTWNQPFAPTSGNPYANYPNI